MGKDDTCTLCGKQSRAFCSQCKLVSYCSKNCQKVHWKQGHKQQCGQMKKMKNSVNELNNYNTTTTTTGSGGIIRNPKVNDMTKQMENCISTLSIQDAMNEMQKAQEEVENLQKIINNSKGNLNDIRKDAKSGLQKMVQAKVNVDKVKKEVDEEEKISEKKQKSKKNNNQNGSNSKLTPEEAKEMGVDNYMDAEYWEERYQKENEKSKGTTTTTPGTTTTTTTTTFEWFVKYHSFQPLLDKILGFKIQNTMDLDDIDANHNMMMDFRTIDEKKQQTKVLNIGCGNSVLSEEMYLDGYRNNMNIDIAPSAVKAMQSRAERQNYTGLQYKTMDARFMTEFEDNSYDLCVDKGTIDAIMCGSIKDTRAVYMEVMRVLKMNAPFLIISMMTPDVIQSVLADFPLKEMIQEQIHTDGYAETVWVYIIKKCDFFKISHIEKKRLAMIKEKELKEEEEEKGKDQNTLLTSGGGTESQEELMGKFQKTLADFKNIMSEKNNLESLVKDLSKNVNTAAKDLRDAELKKTKVAKQVDLAGEELDTSMIEDAKQLDKLEEQEKNNKTFNTALANYTEMKGIEIPEQSVSYDNMVYEWSQTEEDISINMKLKEKIEVSRLSFHADQNYLEIKLKNNTKNKNDNNILLKGDFFSNIVSGDTSWGLINGDSLNINLQKKNLDECWMSCFKGHPEIHKDDIRDYKNTASQIREEMKAADEIDNNTKTKTKEEILDKKEEEEEEEAKKNLRSLNNITLEVIIQEDSKKNNDIIKVKYQFSDVTMIGDDRDFIAIYDADDNKKLDDNDYIDYNYLEDPNQSSGMVELKIPKRIFQKMDRNYVCRFHDENDQILAISEKFSFLEKEEGKKFNALTEEKVKQVVLSGDERKIPKYYLEKQTNVQCLHLYIFDFGDKIEEKSMKIELINNRNEHNDNGNGNINWKVNNLSSSIVNITYTALENNKSIDFGFTLHVDSLLDADIYEWNVQADHIYIRLTEKDTNLSKNTKISNMIDTIAELDDAFSLWQFNLINNKERKEKHFDAMDIQCRFCDHVLIPSGSINSSRPLPTGYLDDVTEYLICYKESAVPLAAHEIHSKTGKALLGDYYFLTNINDIKGGIDQKQEKLAEKLMVSKVSCSRCGTIVGIKSNSGGKDLASTYVEGSVGKEIKQAVQACKSHGHDHGHDYNNNNKCGDSHSHSHSHDHPESDINTEISENEKMKDDVRLFYHRVYDNYGEETIFKSFNIQNYLARRLMNNAKSLSCYNFTLCTNSKYNMKKIHLRLMNWNNKFQTQDSSLSTSTTTTTSSTKWKYSIKVLFKISEDKTKIDPAEIKDLKTYALQNIFIEYDEFEEVIEILNKSSEMFPKTSQVFFKDFNLGILEAF